MNLQDQKIHVKSNQYGVNCNIKKKKSFAKIIELINNTWNLLAQK